MTGSAKYPGRLVGFLACASLWSGIVKAEDAIIDPLTGMVVPLLPGEKVAHFANGCGVILTPSDAYYDDPQSAYGQSYWAGACRFGLVDGFGYSLTKDNQGQWAPITPNPYNRTKLPMDAYPYLGRTLPYALPDTVYFKDRTNPNGSGFVSIERQIPEDKVGGFFNTNEGAVRQRDGQYQSSILAVGTLQTGSNDSFFLNVAKIPCDTDRTVSGSRVVFKVSKNPLHFVLGDGSPPRAAAEIEKQIRPFCEAAITQRLADATEYKYWEPFEKVDYGYYFVVYLQRWSTVVSTDNKTTNPHTTMEIELCPLGQGVEGCDPVWRRMQKPFVEKLDEMRARNATDRAAIIAELDRLYQPLRQAARVKAKEIAAR